MDVFRVRLNCIDHYLTTPTCFDPKLSRHARTSQYFQGSRLPVIRVFGSTETGQKVCAHIHGFFPYLYVEYDGSLEPTEVNAYMYRLHLSIDHALAVSFRRDVAKEQPEFVARITLVKGVPFYGFHVGYRFYFKIYMFNPLVLTRLADLLQQGLIMNRKFQPYEAHIQYLLQFMTDYNLYGCDYIELQEAVFRSPVPLHEDGGESPHRWHSQTIHPDRITDDSTLPRMSQCSIEVDLCVQHIMNRQAIRERRLHHDFVERNSPIPQDMKLVHSMAGLWKDETKRRKRKTENGPPGSSPFPPEVLVSMSADARYSHPAGWIHEEEYREQLAKLIEQEAKANSGPELTFENFVKPTPFEDSVKTAVQSVEDLFPENLAPTAGLGVMPHENLDANPKSSIEVDETGILGMEAGEEDNFFLGDPDEDVLYAAELVDRGKNDQASDVLFSACLNDRVPGTSGFSELSGTFFVSSRNTVVSGLCKSSLQTGRAPEIPVTEELLAAIRAERLAVKMIEKNEMTCQLQELEELSSKTQEGTPVPKAQEADRLTINSLVQTKRSRSPVKESRQTKRPKLEMDNGQNVTLSVPIAQPADLSTSSRNLTQKRCQEQQETRSRGSAWARDPLKRSGSQTLKFAVVKDPNDANTKLRLSQQSASQKSEEVTPKKSLAFEPLPTVENLSSLAPVSDAAVVTPEKTVTDLFENSSMPPSVPTTNAASSQNSTTSLHGRPWKSSRPIFVFGQAPPSAALVCATMQEHDLPDVIYQDPFYGKQKDVPPRMREYAGREFKLEGNTLRYLPEFDDTGKSPTSFGLKAEPADRAKMDSEYLVKQKKCSLRSWEFTELPPSCREVKDWWKAKLNDSKSPVSALVRKPLAATQRAKSYLSQIEGATPRRFKYSQKIKSTSVQHEAHYMSTMSLELHVNTRGKFYPDPEKDEVQCLFWCLKGDESALRQSQATGAENLALTGIVVISEDGSLAQWIRKQTSAEVVQEICELDLMTRMVEIVRAYDPDILSGYEVHGSSWGYLIERARFRYDYNLCDEFSRMKSQSFGRFGKDADRWGFNTTSTIRVTGRHMINIWRAMRGELNLLQYTMENVAWHLLHRRVPHFSWETLTDWYRSGRPRDLGKLIRYYVARTGMDIELLETNELIPRTSEQARLLGVDFFSVFSRGSQFKVESIMFRIAKPENFLLVSPSRKQVGGQNALECLPLVMEPQSAFYSSPLLVLDFQSLYPSVMIAYNYCYSTFLGRIVNWRGINKMGFTEYRRLQGLLGMLKDHVNIAPNGIMYAKPEIRKSLLGKMLKEILETRVMVKSGMKQDKQDKTLQKLLNNRQLALKLLANVTYGYTSASFSGRMPCSEIADSIVQTGRETLERAIAYIHSVEKWGAEVVYGDTDSIFVYLKGRTREQAFDIGQEMVKAITDMNPRPVKLKFEKVYHPCVLLAKKRYVGYKYETRDQGKPEFDAKGIETVRRDGTPAEQKIEERALKLLFETADLSQVKEYFQAQCAKIMRGAVSVQDFCFAKEVKLGTYSANAAPPPGAMISTRRILADARAEPQYGERVPYVVVSGAPGARLIDRCIPPEELLGSSHLELDAQYYICKNLIPPLERIFNLVGANVRAWYDEMPKVQRVRRVESLSMAAAGHRKTTLESYLRSANCVSCGVKMKTRFPSTLGMGAALSRPVKRSNISEPETDVLCRWCVEDTVGTMVRLQTRLRREESRLLDVARVCQSCAGLAPLEEVLCNSKDCPVYYTRVKQGASMRSERAVAGPALKYLEGVVGRADRGLEW